MQLLSTLDLAKNQLQNAAVHNLTAAPANPVVGQLYFNTTASRLYVCTVGGASPTWSELTVNYDMANNALTSVADPTNPQDAATKNYVDLMRQGLQFKDPVRFATAAVLPNSPTYSAGVLTSATNAALVVDGVTVSLGDRILVKDQSTGTQNGIYTVTQVGSGSAVWKLTRATDANGASEVAGGTFVFCTEGNTNADTAWVCSNNGAVTIDTTSISFVLFATITSTYAGAGLIKNGNVLDVVGTANRLTVNADSIDVNTSLLPSPVAGDLNKALVASGANTAAWTTIVRKAVVTLAGDGTKTSWPISHNLGTWDIQVAVYDNNGTNARNLVLCDVSPTSTSACTLTISPAITNAVTWTAVVIG